ncbi:MAG: GNAT family N-acetyltransferase [Clostridiales bacterium]|nr:GNAT family N-acetyltransferase [Clostridiales bacterium]
MDFRIVDQIDEKDEREIFEALKAYNLSLIEDTNFKDLGIYLEDENGKKIAGMIAETHGNWLSVHYLWVDESMRGKRIGEKILHIAEEEAKRRGCKYAFLDTFSFQAPGFYTKYGYKEVFVLEEYPLTGKRYYYTKTL